MGNTWARDIQGMLGIHEIGQYLKLWQAVQHVSLTHEPDRLRWRWTASGTYTAQSCYAATFHGSTRCPSWKLTWRSWAPPRVRFFHWLANQDRCWTATRLARHSLQHHPRCLMCDQAPETIQHLLLACPFSRQSGTPSWTGHAFLHSHRTMNRRSWTGGRERKGRRPTRCAKACSPSPCSSHG